MANLKNATRRLALAGGFALAVTAAPALAVVAGIATLGPLLAAITPTLLNFLFGIVAGAVVLAGVLLVKRLLPKKKKTG